MVETAYYSDIGGRTCNEDSVRIVARNGGTLLILCDGLGGHGGGDAASRAAVELVCDKWNGTAEPSHLEELLLAAHEKICSMQTPACKMKSTAVMLVIKNGTAAWAFAGDTRLYHFIDGVLVGQTRDHSASQVAVFLGEITPDQIRFHADRSKIFRALGLEGELAIDTASEALAQGKHAFLLCSDGFWEYVLEAEMTAELRRAASPDEWIASMRKILAGRIPADNDNNTAAAAWVNI